MTSTMTSGAALLEVELGLQSDLLSWNFDSGLIAVGSQSSQRRHAHVAEVQIICLHSPSQNVNLLVPLQDASDKLVCCAWSSTRPSSSPRKPPLLLTATASGTILTWSQQPSQDDRRAPSSLQEWHASTLPTLPLPKQEQHHQQQQQQQDMLHSLQWLAPPSPFTWRPAAFQDTGPSSSHAPARLDSCFSQAAAAPSSLAAAGFGCDWLSRSSVAFVAVTRKGLVVLFWSRFGREGSLDWRHTSLMALPTPGTDDGSQRQQLTSIAFMPDAPARLKVAYATSSNPHVVHVAQLQGDPIFAAAAAAGSGAGGGQVLLQVAPYGQLQLSPSYQAAALAFKPCISSSGDVTLAVVSTIAQGVSPAAAAAGGGGGETGTPSNHEQQQPELQVDKWVLPASQGSATEEAPTLSSPSARYTYSRATGQAPLSRSSSVQCCWSPDCSWLAVAAAGSSQVLLLDEEGLQPRPSPSSVGSGSPPGLGRSDSSSIVAAAAASPSSASVAVLYQGTGPGASVGHSRLAVHALGLSGSNSDSSGSSSSSEHDNGASSNVQQQKQQVALAGGRVLWCLVTSAHHWDVVQQLVHLGRTSAPQTAPTAADPAAPSSSSSSSFSLPAVMGYVDHKVHCHPVMTRSVYVSRWDVVKLGVLMLVPGQEAGSLAQELYLRGMVIRGLGALREALEAAHAELTVRHVKGGKESTALNIQRLTDSDKALVVSAVAWLFEFIELQLSVHKSWLATRQGGQGQPPGGGGGLLTGSRLLVDCSVRQVVNRTFQYLYKHYVSVRTDNVEKGQQHLVNVFHLYNGHKLPGSKEDMRECLEQATAAFPSGSYHLHYSRMFAWTSLCEWLSDPPQGSSTWAALPLLTEEEVQKRLKKLGVTWVQTPAAAASFQRELQLYHGFRATQPGNQGQGCSSSSSSSMAAPRGTPPAKRRRWLAQHHAALGDPLVRLAGGLPRDLSDCLVLGALPKPAGSSARPQGMLMAADGSVATAELQLGVLNDAGELGSYLMQPQRLAWLHASPITGEGWMAPA